MVEYQTRGGENKDIIIRDVENSIKRGIYSNSMIRSGICLAQGEDHLNSETVKREIIADHIEKGTLEVWGKPYKDLPNEVQEYIDKEYLNYLKEKQ